MLATSNVFLSSSYLGLRGLDKRSESADESPRSEGICSARDRDFDGSRQPEYGLQRYAGSGKIVPTLFLQIDTTSDTNPQENESGATRP